MKGIGDMLVLTTQLREYEPVREIYGLSMDGGLVHPTLIRVETWDGRPILSKHSTYYGWRDYAVTRCTEETNWRELMEPGRLPDLLASLVYITSRPEPGAEGDRVMNERRYVDGAISYLKTSGLLSTLLGNENPWVREYAEIVSAEAAAGSIGVSQ